MSVVNYTALSPSVAGGASIAASSLFGAITDSAALAITNYSFCSGDATNGSFYVSTLNSGVKLTLKKIKTI